MAINPNLPSRYEIRPLDLAHADWVNALLYQSNVFHSPLWVPILGDNRPKTPFAFLRASRYLVEHQLKSGYSLGVFDKEYEYKRPESAATGGRLYWESDDSDSAELDQATLLERMDFPLVSVALSYDSIDPLDMSKLADFFEILPAFPALHMGLAAHDRRDAASWEAKGPREVLFRAATSTHPSYEGRGLMKGLAHALMRQAADQGFRGIQIETAHDAVTHVWKNPPPPFEGEIVSSINTHTYELTNDEGVKSYPLRPATLDICKIYVKLR